MHINQEIFQHCFFLFLNEDKLACIENYLYSYVKIKMSKWNNDIYNFIKKEKKKHVCFV